MRWRISSVTKTILLLTFLYFIGISLIVFITASQLFISTDNHSFKELLCGIWGYGWDGWLNLKIAQEGYQFPLQAFFPLYPLLLRGLHLVLPWSLAYRINLLFLPGILLVGYRLLEFVKIKREHKLLAIIALLFFPTSYFLQASYADTLFVFLSTWSLLFLLQDRHYPAAAVSALATATKSNGIVLSLIVVLSFVVTHRRTWQKPLNLLHVAALSVLSNLGVLFYFIYLQLTFGSFRIFFQAHEEWKRTSSSLINIPLAIQAAFLETKIIWKTQPTYISRVTIELALFIFGVYLLVLAWRKMRWELYAFSLLQFLLPISSGSLLSLPRLMLFSFPVILYFGTKLKSPSVLAGYIFISTLLQTLFVLMFVNNVFLA